MPTMLAFIQNIGPWQWLILLAVGLLIFGRRLPEIGRNLGKSIVEFKKGLKDIECEIDDAERKGSESESRRLSEKTDDDSRRVSTSDVIEEQPQSS